MQEKMCSEIVTEKLNLPTWVETSVLIIVVEV